MGAQCTVDLFGTEQRVSYRKLFSLRQRLKRAKARVETAHDLEKEKPALVFKQTERFSFFLSSAHCKQAPCLALSLLRSMHTMDLGNN
eukprot:1156190-Pelagomonas_calceolata.AAC.8